MRYHNVFWDASNCCFTSIELRQVIELLKRPEFNPAEINNNLHDRHLQFAEFAINNAMWTLAPSLIAVHISS